MTELEPGTPLANTVQMAQSAVDAPTADVAYREAVELAKATVATATVAAIARDHVASLLGFRAYSLGLRRCTEHLETLPDDQILRLTRAEIRAALADYGGARQDVDTVRAVSSAGDRARVRRLRGLIAADDGDHDSAERHLDQARALFAAAGFDAGVAIVDRDTVMLGVHRGDPLSIAEALSAPARSSAEHLQLARALKRELRYEEAIAVLRSATSVDPKLRPVLREEETDLLRLTRHSEVGVTAVVEPDSPRLDRRLRHAHHQVIQVRELLARRRPADAVVLVNQAESALLELRPGAETDVERATWHLVAGELELTRGQLLGLTAAPADEVDWATNEAAGHLERAAQCAGTKAAAEVRRLALRQLGHAYVRLGVGEKALASWHEAYHVEEEIAAQQKSDEYKVRMLLAAGDEHDEWIAAAAAAIDKHGLAAAAGIAVAIEAAMGPLTTEAISGRRARLPWPGDIVGACAWVRELTRDLPSSQAMWLMYPATDRVHHIVAGRTMSYYATAPRHGFRNHLAAAVDTLASFWTETNLERSVRSGEFDAALNAIGELLDIGPVLRELSGTVKRVAMVVPGILYQVPVAALPVPGTADRLVHRFALSDLPSLSVRRPLRQRSNRQRGERSLLVQPVVPEFTAAAPLPGRTLLTGDRACVDELKHTAPGHHIVRVDGHGRYDEPDHWLALADRLPPTDLQLMDLSGCGTVILGACDSGMARTAGRDERIGFVRSALHAGSSAVVAARWIAEEPVASALLDRFERYLRFLPRDIALQRAQLDTCEGPADLPEHPARWACWALYGDAGRQTHAGPVRRWLRARRDNAKETS